MGFRKKKVKPHEECTLPFRLKCRATMTRKNDDGTISTFEFDGSDLLMGNLIKSIEVVGTPLNSTELNSTQLNSTRIKFM